MAEAAVPAAAGGLEAIARGWIGTRFRPQGRSRRGVDCVGLVLCVAAQGGIALADRRDYALRGNRVEDAVDGLRARGLRPVPVAEAMPGDLLLSAPAPGQVHLAIRSSLGVVEADLRCGRVVERPMRDDDGWHSAWRFGGSDGDPAVIGEE